MANINDYGFPFSSVEGDRQYSASEWRDYFGTLIKDGVVRNSLNECQVKPQTVPNKTVKVDAGTMFIRGAMRILGTAQTLSIDDNTSENPRIDRIVARLNFTDRKIEFAVLKGTPASSPVAVSLRRNTSVWELALADVKLSNGFSAITGTEITDQRQDTDLCGASSMTIGVIPPSGADAETVILSSGTAAKYGEIEVDSALDKISNTLYRGLYSQLSGGDGKIGNAQDGYITFSTTDIDELSSAGSSQFTVPSGVTRVRFWFDGEIGVENGNATLSASIKLHKNSSEIMEMVRMSGLTGERLKSVVYTPPVACVGGDVFKLYADLGTFGTYYSSLTAGSKFGMEILK